MAKKLPRYWFHGDTAPRNGFLDQRWDRKRHESSLNAEGPGIYFTESEEDAESYGPHLYVAELKPGFKFLPKRRPTVAFLRKLYIAASPEDRELFLSNWDNMTVPRILEKYSHQLTMHDAAVSLYSDLIRDPAAWVYAMRELGYDGHVVEHRYGARHLVVWNPNKITVREAY